MNPPVDEPEMRELVSLSSRVLGEAGLDDYIWGHSSARDPHGRGAWIKRSGIGLSEVMPDDVHLVSPAGAVVRGHGDAHIEYPIHTEIYAARPDVGGIVHLHPPHAVALAASGADLLPVSHQATLFTAPAVPRYRATTDLIRTRALGRAVADELGAGRAVHLVNHGIVTVAPDLPSATLLALLLEEACAQHLRTLGFGGIAHWSGDEEVRAKRERIYPPAALHKAWAYLVRGLDDTPSARADDELSVPRKTGERFSSPS
jgi:ribulose-5-phosphate 4-epimerase/fuculose-1-phosphate aldolase